MYPIWEALRSLYRHNFMVAVHVSNTWYMCNENNCYICRKIPSHKPFEQALLVTDKFNIMSRSELNVLVEKEKEK